VDIVFKFDGVEAFTGGSDAYVRRVKGPVYVRGRGQEVAALRLPAGKWVVSAKAVLMATSNTPDAVAVRTVHSRLVASELSKVLAGAEDEAVNSLTPVPRVNEDGGNEVSHYDTTALLLGVDLRTGGNVSLSADTNEQALYREVVISAIRVNSLSIDAG
jgi:hypothetical protein